MGWQRHPRQGAQPRRKVRKECGEGDYSCRSMPWYRLVRYWSAAVGFHPRALCPAVRKEVWHRRRYHASQFVGRTLLQPRNFEFRQQIRWRQTQTWFCALYLATHLQAHRRSHRGGEILLQKGQEGSPALLQDVQTAGYCAQKGRERFPWQEVAEARHATLVACCRGAHGDDCAAFAVPLVGSAVPD